MRRWWLVVTAVVLLVLVVVVRRARESAIVLLKEVPAIEHSGLDHVMTYKDAEIDTDRFMVRVRGWAKVDMGRVMPITVERYMDGAKVDTVSAAISLGMMPRVPDGYVHPKNAGGPPPYNWDILADDPVEIVIDATTTEGRFDKLVLRPEGPATGVFPGR